MIRTLRNLLKSREGAQRKETVALEDLEKMWGPVGRPPAPAYQQHYLEQCNTFKFAYLGAFTFKDRVDLLVLVNILRQNGTVPLQQLVDNFAAGKIFVPWIKDPKNTDHVKAAIRFACRMWLFTRPSLNDLKLTLVQDIHSVLEKTTGQFLPRLHLTDLDHTFSAKTLVTNGKFRIIWTHDVSQHLSFESKKALRIFCHASALDNYRQDSHAEDRQFYPDKFLQNTCETFELLYPTGPVNSAREVAVTRSKCGVDITVDLETGPDNTPYRSLELVHYPIWGGQLAQIQERYEAARSEREKWLQFWIAIVAILVVNIVFGIISSITSALQVAIAYKTLKQNGA